MKLPLIVFLTLLALFIFFKWRANRPKKEKTAPQLTQPKDIREEKKKIKMPAIRIGNGLVKFFIFLIFLAIVLVGWYRSEKIYEHYQQQRYQKSMHTIQR